MAGGQRVFDGNTSYLSGCDYGRQPSLIRDNQYWNSVNCTARGGYLTNRPGWIARPVSFSIPASYSRFVIGNPQGMTVYQSQGSAYLIVSSGGRQYSIDPIANFSSQDITPDGGNARNITKTYFSQWENYLIIQDGQSRPIYLNGLTATRDNRPENGIPVGTAMAYGWGRGWVAQGNQLAAGDISGGASNVITFTDINFLTGGGAFQLPAMLGDINGMAFIPLQDTATGQGQLLIGGDYGVSSVNGALPRDLWQVSEIQKVAMLNVGWASQNANVLLNGDIFFRSYDGIRSYRMARAQQGINGNTPQSEEVSPYLDKDSQSLLKYASGVNFDNRILITTAPEFVNGTTCRWKGLVVLDSYPCGTLWGNNPPVWEGMWDGLNIVQICTGVFNKETRCFALVQRDNPTVLATITGNSGGFTVDNPSLLEVDGIYNFSGAGYFKIISITGNVIGIEVIEEATNVPVGSTISIGNRNEIWELTKNSAFDFVDGEKIPIRSSVTTKSYDFQTPFSQKNLSQLNFWVDDVRGQVDWTAKFRPDQYPCFYDFSSGSLCQDDAECGEDECPNLNRQPSYKPRISRSAPSIRACNEVTERPRISGYEFQFILEWTGKMRVRQLRIDAISTTDQTRGDTSEC